MTQKAILLVDDDLEMLQLLSQILRDEGYIVHETCGSQDARDRMERGEYGDVDLLVSDLVMPNVGGLELAAWFRDAYPDAGILIISAYTNEMLILEGKLSEGTNFLSKPFRTDVFRKKVASLLQG